MSSVRFSLLILFLAVVFQWCTAQAEVRVVVNRKNPITELSTYELRRIFSGQTRVWPNGTAVHLILPASGPARTALKILVRAKDEQDLSLFYLKLQFQQRLSTLPEEFPSSEETLGAVVANPGAITLVQDSELKDLARLKVVTVRN